MAKPICDVPSTPAGALAYIQWFKGCYPERSPGRARWEAVYTLLAPLVVPPVPSTLDDVQTSCGSRLDGLAVLHGAPQRAEHEADAEYRNRIMAHLLERMPPAEPWRPKIGDMVWTKVRYLGQQDTVLIHGKVVRLVQELEIGGMRENAYLAHSTHLARRHIRVPVHTVCRTEDEARGLTQWSLI